MLTTDQIAACTGASLERAAEHCNALGAAMDAYDICTPARQAAFLAQVGHETGGLHYLREIWGPTPAQERYEGRADLGNSQPGDGRRYAGHGMIQTTGRANHARVRDRLRERFPDLDVPDFEADPMALCQSQWAALSAADYWDEHRCNDLADIGAFGTITRRINGGTNGMADRLERHACAQACLGGNA